MSEHDCEQPAPAPQVSAPVSAPGEAAPMAAGFSPAAPRTPKGVLALQRKAGNAAVTQLLSRKKKLDPNDPAASTTVTSNDVEFTGGVPTLTGTTEVKPANVGAGSTRVFGPTMSVKAEVSLKSGVELESGVTVGYIQTMTQADRVAVYTSDGTPGGQKLVEEHVSVLMGKTQDAAGHFQEDKNHNMVKGPDGRPVFERNVGPPWFDSPGVLDDAAKTQSPSATDHPSFPIPTEVKDPKGNVAKLAQTKGAESFQIALAIKDGAAAPIKLAITNWGVDWTTTVDPNVHTGTGNKGQVVPALGAFAGVGDGTGLTHSDAVSWRAPQNDEEAMAMSSRELLTALPPARQNDADAYARIARALRAKNPAFSVTVHCDEDDSYVGGDDIEVTAEGTRGVKSRSGTVETGKDFATSFALLELFDPDEITRGRPVVVKIAKKGESAQDRSWVWPFGTTENKTHRFSGDSKYRMTMSAG
jgi:hypothetical protein